MSRKNKARVSILGMEMQSPFIVGSGPLSHSGASMIELHRNGAGAVVTKTIRNEPADNPFPHIATIAPAGSMINAELWSDIPGEQWVEEEIPAAAREEVAVVASIGHTEEEAAKWVPPADRAGAQAIELVSYDQRTMGAMVRAAVSATKKPVIAKLSPNWKDPLSGVKEMEELGVSGFTVMDSLGPVLRIDIKTGLPLMGSEDGRGWLTGAALKPMTLHYIALLHAHTTLPIIGLGGCVSSEDAVEMAMAGAAAVGVCSVLMVRGPAYLKTLTAGTEALLEKLGYASLGEIRGLFNRRKHTPFTGAPEFRFSPGVCTDCGRCRTVCSYAAQKTTSQALDVDYVACRYCGLCVSVCPTGAMELQWKEDSQI